MRKKSNREKEELQKVTKKKKSHKVESIDENNKIQDDMESCHLRHPERHVKF